MFANKVLFHGESEKISGIRQKILQNADLDFNLSSHINNMRVLLGGTHEIFKIRKSA